MPSRILFGVGLVLLIGCGEVDTPGEAGTVLAPKEQEKEVQMVWNGLAEAGSSDKDEQLGVQFASDRRAVLFYQKGRVSVFPLGTVLPSGLLALDENQKKIGIGAESFFTPEEKPTEATNVMRAATTPTHWATVHAGGFVRVGEIEPCRLLKQLRFGSYTVEWQTPNPESAEASAPRDQDWATESGADVRLGPQAAQLVEGGGLSLLRITGAGDCERVQFSWLNSAEEASVTTRRFAAARAEDLDAPMGGGKSNARRIWLLAPDGQTGVEVGSKACAIWSKEEKPFLVAYSPLPVLSAARIGHDGTSLTIAGVEATPEAVDSRELPLQVRVVELIDRKANTVEVNGALNIAEQDYQIIETLISPDKRFSIVNTRSGLPTVFDLKTKRQIKLEMSDKLRGKIEASFPTPRGMPVASPSGKVVGFDGRSSFFTIGQLTIEPAGTPSSHGNASSPPRGLH